MHSYTTDQTPYNFHNLLHGVYATIIRLANIKCLNTSQPTDQLTLHLCAWLSEFQPFLYSLKHIFAV